jgi:anti-anti-sigma factor
MNAMPTTSLVKREDMGHVTVLRLEVPTLLDDATTEAVFQEAYALVDGGRASLVLNLHRVEFLASAAVGKLIALYRKVREAGGRLALCKVQRPVHGLLRLVRLTDILIAYEDEQEAVDSFA